MHYASMIPHSPSMVAAAAVYAARCTLNVVPQWSEALKKHSGFSEDAVKESAGKLVELHQSAPESKLKAVYKKYSCPNRGAVACYPPVTKLFGQGSSCTS